VSAFTSILLRRTGFRHEQLDADGVADGLPGLQRYDAGVGMALVPDFTERVAQIELRLERYEAFIGRRVSLKWR
jgi:hypothetical protein